MKTFWKTIKLRALLLVSTLGITWLVTGNPTTSVTVTAIQQTTNFGIQYWWEKNELSKLDLKKIKQEIDIKQMPEHYKKYPPEW
jgi:Predicted membrane protein (DUF2061)